jgi:hypothetical protein
MKQDQNTTGNVVRFRRSRLHHGSARDQKNLMEAVYCAGSLPIGADDRESKVVAARLHLYGFVMIDAIEPDGSTRRLRPSESVHASLARPWRISKASAASGAASGSPVRVSVATVVG